MIKAYLSFAILLITITLQFSCFKKLNKQKDYPTIMSKEEIDQHMREQVQLKGDFDWSYVSDEVLYSAALHSKSILYITYSVTPNGGSLPMNDENYKKTGKLPLEWIRVRDEIIQYILEKERAHRKQPDLTVSQILFPRGSTPSETLPDITVIISAPSLVSDLRENELIKSLEPGYTPSSMDWYIEK